MLKQTAIETVDMVQQLDLKKRLSKLLNQMHNKGCADCPARNPRNASLLQKPLVKGGNQIGVFCCDACAIGHCKLGEEVCRVKSVTDTFSLREIWILENSGNQFVNGVLEATITDEDKSDGLEALIRRKYKERKYFCKEKLYQNTAVRAKANKYAAMMSQPADGGIKGRADRLLNRGASRRNVANTATEHEEVEASKQALFSLIGRAQRGGEFQWQLGVPGASARIANAPSEGERAEANDKESSPITKATSSPTLSTTPGLEEEGNRKRNRRRRPSSSNTLSKLSEEKRMVQESKKSLYDLLGIPRPSTGNNSTIKKNVISTNKPPNREPLPASIETQTKRDEARPPSPNRSIVSRTQPSKGPSDRSHTPRRALTKHESFRMNPSRASRGVQPLSKHESFRVLSAQRPQVPAKQESIIIKDAGTSCQAGNQWEANDPVKDVRRKLLYRSEVQAGPLEQSLSLTDAFLNIDSDISDSDSDDCESDDSESDNTDTESESSIDDDEIFRIATTTTPSMMRNESAAVKVRPSRRDFGMGASDPSLALIVSSEVEPPFKRHSSSPDMRAEPDGRGVSNLSKVGKTTKYTQKGAAEGDSVTDATTDSNSEGSNERKRKGGGYGNRSRSLTQHRVSRDTDNHGKQSFASENFEDFRERTPSRSSRRDGGREKRCSSSKSSLRCQLTDSEQPRCDPTISVPSANSKYYGSGRREESSARERYGSKSSSFRDSKRQVTSQTVLSRPYSRKDVPEYKDREDSTRCRRKSRSSDFDDRKDLKKATVEMTEAKHFEGRQPHSRDSLANYEGKGEEMKKMTMEGRIRTVLSRPENQVCSDCSNESPTWASFFVSPVDGRRLGVFCCFLCYGLHKHIGRDYFELKNIREVKQWTEHDIETVELSGNKVCNLILEALVHNEKNDRDNHAQGREAYHFEKYVNFSYFCDTTSYGKIILEAARENRLVQEALLLGIDKSSSGSTNKSKDENTKKSSLSRHCHSRSSSERDVTEQRRSSRSIDSGGSIKHLSKSRSRRESADFGQRSFSRDQQIEGGSGYYRSCTDGCVRTPSNASSPGRDTEKPESSERHDRSSRGSRRKGSSCSGDRCLSRHASSRSLRSLGSRQTLSSHGGDSKTSNHTNRSKRSGRTLTSSRTHHSRSSHKTAKHETGDRQCGSTRSPSASRRRDA